MEKTTKQMVARFWTKKECGTTLAQCKRAGLTIEQTDGMTKIYNNDDLVVSWIVGGSGQPNMVRVDLNYFE